MRNVYRGIPNGAGAFIACLLFTASVCLAEQAPIPASELAALEQELEQSAIGKSAVKVRIAFKDVARQASALLEASPEAPNRYAVIAILFRCQKKLLGLEVTKKNRNALFATCAKLSKAPDQYADLRLEADLLLSERDLAKAEATVTERVRALEEIIGKYRNTSAERRCLRLTMMLASQHRASDLEIKIKKKLAVGRFAGDQEMIALRPLADLNAVFSGRYQSADKALVSFPSDRLGHQYLVIFWSTKPKGPEGHETFLARIKEQQERFPGRFEVYSFNLDELPDAGKSILSQSGVKGTALHLPGGRRHLAYKAYARRAPAAVLVNAQGHSSLNAQMAPWPMPTPARGKVAANPGPGLGMWLDDERYVAQLRSLFIGDFLVADPRPASSIKAIQSCFTLPPMRYRLTRKAELDGYRRAEKLCAAAILQNPTAPDIWRVRNRRIIALIGMGNLAREAKYMEQAVEEAKAMLATKLPPGADVVARFCLLKDALWKAGAIPEVLLRDFIDTQGGDKAPIRALAAAAVLAIEANAEPLYQKCRQRFLCLSDENHPRLWPVLSLIRDRHHNHRMFWGNPGRWGYSETQRYKGRYVVSGVGAPEKPNRVLAATLKGLDGRDVRIPQDLAGKMGGIVFVEPPADASEREVCVKRLKNFVGQFSRLEVPVIVAFLSENTDTVKSIVKECGGSFRAAMAPGGLGSPLVRRLGILSSDRIPNPFLLHGDGAIAWWISGLSYTVSRTPMDGAASAAIGINIEKVRADRMFLPLEQGDYKRAVSLLSGRVPLYWDADRLQGRALAHMGLKDWKTALTDIDAALASRQTASRHKKAISLGEAEMHLAKSTILKKLGRDKEAAKERTTAEQYLAWLENQPSGDEGHVEKPPSYARYGVPVGVYDNFLKRIRVGLSGEKKTTE
jgi:hypothetical protein